MIRLIERKNSKAYIQALVTGENHQTRMFRSVACAESYCDTLHRSLKCYPVLWIKDEHQDKEPDFPLLKSTKWRYTGHPDKWRFYSFHYDGGRRPPYKILNGANP